MAFDKDGAGVTEAFASLSERVTDYRISRAKGISFSKKVWEEQGCEKKKKNS